MPCFGSLIFPFEEVDANATIDMAPGQRLIHRAFLGIKLRVKPDFMEGLLPPFVAKVVAPGIEGGAKLECELDDWPQAAVTPSQHSLDQTHLRIWPR